MFSTDRKWKAFLARPFYSLSTHKPEGSWQALKIQSYAFRNGGHIRRWQSGDLKAKEVVRARCDASLVNPGGGQHKAETMELLREIIALSRRDPQLGCQIQAARRCP